MSASNTIQGLRKAASVSTTQNSDKLWCVISGNEQTVNNIAYSAISTKDKVQILFREHIDLKDGFLSKQFDFIMVYGETQKIRELNKLCKDNGGAYINIAPYYVQNKTDLFLIVGPDDSIKKFINESKLAKIDFNFVLDDSTTGFIETDISVTHKLPNVIREILDPLFKLTDVVLRIVLFSSDKKEIDKLKRIAKENKIFIIEFNEIL